MFLLAISGLHEYFINPPIAIPFLHTNYAIGVGVIYPQDISSSRADRNEIPAATPIFGVKLFKGGVGDFVNHAVQLQIHIYNHDFGVDFDIIRSHRPIGIEVRSTFGIIMYINQYGGRETGSSYNF